MALVSENDVSVTASLSTLDIASILLQTLLDSLMA